MAASWLRRTGHHDVDLHAVSRQTYRIVIPTRDSAGWIGAFAHAYRRLGVEPIYLLDRRSKDATREVLRDIGADVRIVYPQLDRVEDMLDSTGDIPSDWLVRFDDDELPSRALLTWLEGNLASMNAPVLALSRRDLYYHDSTLCYSRMETYYFHQDDPTYLCPQYRAYRPDAVRFDNTIHSHGFVLDQYEMAPAGLYFVHFDWLMRSFEQRREKLRRYEAQQCGAGWANGQFYLPELHHAETCRWTPIETEEFQQLADQVCRPVLRKRSIT